jgi:hypothetical protein
MLTILAVENLRRTEKFEKTSAAALLRQSYPTTLLLASLNLMRQALQDDNIFLINREKYIKAVGGQNNPYLQAILMGQ